MSKLYRKGSPKNQFLFILCFLLFCSFILFLFFLIASKTKNVQRSNKIFYVFNCLFSLDLLACFNNLSLSFINKAGAPNENIVQNHLNIALLSVF